MSQIICVQQKLFTNKKKFIEKHFDKVSDTHRNTVIDKKEKLKKTNKSSQSFRQIFIRWHRLRLNFSEHDFLIKKSDINCART